MIKEKPADTKVMAWRRKFNKILVSVLTKVRNRLGITGRRSVMPTGRQGQALIELLIGVAIGALIMGSSAAIIRTVVNSNDSVQKVKVATDLGREIINNIRVYADSEWKDFYELNKGPSNHYYVDSTASQFTITSGDQTVTRNGLDYTRYFYVGNINRDYDSPDDIVTSGGALDPSTQQVNVVIVWQDGTPITFTEIISRYRNFTVRQSNWAGGTDNTNILTVAGDSYVASTGVNASTTGEFKLLGF